MKTVDEMVDDILEREGGFVDHPDDQGGPTNHGISLRYALGLGLDLDGDGDTDKDDIVLVSPEEAACLYKQDFFYGPRIHLLPECLHAQLFDIAVNSGGHRAIKLLQKALNRGMGRYEVPSLETDGRMGPKTRRTAEVAVEVLRPEGVSNLIVGERIAFYKAIVDHNPSQNVFLRGWLRRAQEFESK